MTLTDRYQAGVENSTLRRWIRASYLVRWLTAEPEPEVIVIDLRDTYTIGPFIAVLDWIITSLEPAYRNSRLRASGRRINAAFLGAPIRVFSLTLLVPALAWLAYNALTNPISIRSLLPPLVLVGLAIVGTRITRSWAELQENRAVAFVISAFAPPEPPDAQSSATNPQPKSTVASDADPEDR